MTEPHLSLPRRQRWLLPGGLVEGRGGRRTARDWLVDWIAFVLALGIGAAALQDTWHDHSQLAAVVDIVLGAVAVVALWFRRSYPVAVAVLAVGLSFVSASAAG